MSADVLGMLDAPNLIREIDGTRLCAFCGRPATELHHIVPRSLGGTNGPVASVCGWGNTCGCHGLLHSHRLTLDWDGEAWRYLRTPEPVSRSAALGMDGWVVLRV